MKHMLALAALLSASPAMSQAVPQTIGVDLSPMQAQIKAAQQAAQAATDLASAAQSAAASKCAATPVVPSMEVVGGAAGTTGVGCRPVNSVQPRITRTAACTLVSASSIASCDATWDTNAFPAGTNIRLTGAPAVTTATQGPATEQPITCKAYNITVTGISFRCWTSQTLAINLAGVTAGLNLSPFAAASGGVVVQVTAIPAS